jgi:hypothetical protein
LIKQEQSKKQVADNDDDDGRNLHDSISCVDVDADIDVDDVGDINEEKEEKRSR